MINRFSSLSRSAIKLPVDATKKNEPTPTKPPTATLKKSHSNRSIGSASSLVEEKRRSHRMEDAVSPLPVRISGRAERVKSKTNRFVVLRHLVDPNQENEYDFKLSHVSLCAIFEGFKGTNFAEFASESLAEHIVKCAANQRCADMDELQYIIPDAFKAANEDFKLSYPGDPSGSSGVAMLVMNRQVVIAWCGTCKAVMRTGVGGTVLLTKPVSSLETSRESDSNETGNRKSLGSTTSTSDFAPVMVVPEFFEPEIATFNVPSDDGTSSSKSRSFAVLASNALWSALSADEVCELVECELNKPDGNVDTATATLIKTVTSKTSGNASCIIVQWPSTDSVEFAGGVLRSSLRFSQSPTSATSESHQQLRLGGNVV